MTAALRVSVVFFSLMLFSFFLPKTIVAGVFLGLDDFLCLLYLIFVFYFILNVQITEIYMPVLVLLFFSVLYMFLGMLQGYEYTGLIKMPTEMWQYFKRATCFFLALYCFKNLSTHQIVKLIKFVLIACVLLLVIGFLQKLGFDFLTDLYSRNERQMLAGLSSKSNQRIFGVSGFSTSWGGMVIFIFYAIIALESILRSVTNKRFLGNFTFILLTFLVLVNVFSSGSRAAMIAFLVSVFFFYIFIFRKLSFFINFFVLIVFSLLCLVITYVAFNFFSNELEFVIYRFDKLFETGGGGRSEQITEGIGLITNVNELFFGISNLAQRFWGSSWGIESEPFYIFVNYGVIGLLILYGTLYFILHLIQKYSYIAFGDVLNRLVFYSALKAGVLGYLVFSVGYFYFSEVIVGNFSWLILGLSVGVMSNLNFIKLMGGQSVTHMQ